MKDIIEKITTYNLFNYFFPGVLFTFLVSNLTIYNLIQEDLLIGVFLYYFIGLVVSRTGSLLLEPFLKSITFLKFTDYKDFVDASKKDEKISDFSEINNMYRTLCSMFVLVLMAKAYEQVALKFNITVDVTTIILVLVLSVLFFLSYRKQTEYITKRINYSKEK